MTQEKIDMYVMTNQKYLPAEKIIFIKQKLQEIDEEKFSLVSTRFVWRRSLHDGRYRNGNFEIGYYGIMRNFNHCGLVFSTEKNT